MIVKLRKLFLVSKTGLLPQPDVNAGKIIAGKEFHTRTGAKFVYCYSRAAYGDVVIKWETLVITCNIA